MLILGRRVSLWCPAHGRVGGIKGAVRPVRPIGDGDVQTLVARQKRCMLAGLDKVNMR